MKKIITAILLAAMLAASLAACKDNSDDTSSAPADNSIVLSDSESGSADESSGEESVAEFVESEDVALIKSYLTADIDASMKAKNIFRGMTYSYNVAPESSYDDPNKTKLTDGIVRDIFDGYNWVAFTKGNSVNIDFDLGDNDHALAVVEVETLRQKSYGISLPGSVKLAVSDDGENYTVISSITTPADTNESTKYIYRFALPKATSARYVRVICNRSDGGFIFLDEIFGYEYCEDGDVDISVGEIASRDEGNFDFYKYNLKKDVSVPVSPSDSDYGTYQNLARLDGVDIQIRHFDPMNESVEADNTPIEEAYKLTDGKYASYATYGDSAWFKFVRAHGRHVVIDLGNVMAVDKLTAEILDQSAAGVAVPPVVNVSVSSDGENWVTVYGDYTKYYGDRSVTECYKLEAAFKNEYKARYVRFTFPTVLSNDVSVMVYVSEIEIWGKKDASSAAVTEYDKTIVMGRYPDPEDFGVKAMLFAGIGTVIDSSSAYRPLDEDQAKIYYGKKDENGKYVGVMFDSYCFAPMKSFASTGNLFNDFKQFADETYFEGINLDALDKAVAAVNAELGIDKKATYWLNLNCLGAKAKNADEVYESLKQQADYAIEKDRAAGYKNVKLLGFYYNDETLFTSNDDIAVEGLKRFNDYLHSKGYMGIWCPYYAAYGSWRWKEAGFDIACLQPNFMFYSVESTRLNTCAEIAKLYGMCVELELEQTSSAEACAIYRQYLRAGVLTGYMNSVQFYYEGAVGGAIGSALNHTEDFSKQVYEDTYKYIHNMLDSSYNQGEVVDMSGLPESVELTVKGGRYKTSSDCDLTGLTYRYLLTPQFGSIRVDMSGTIAYSAMKGYRGSDKAIIEVSDPAGNRRIVTVNVTVTE